MKQRTIQKEAFLSDLIRHSELTSVSRKEGVTQFKLSEIIIRREELKGKTTWLRDDERPKTDFYEITSSETGAHRRISKKRWEELDPSKKLRVWDYDPSRPLIITDICKTGLDVVDNFGYARLVARLAGEKQAEPKLLKAEKRVR